jgi:hypothetical protein
MEHYERKAPFFAHLCIGPYNFTAFVSQQPTLLESVDCQFDHKGLPSDTSTEFRHVLDQLERFQTVVGDYQLVYFDSTWWTLKDIYDFDWDGMAVAYTFMPRDVVAAIHDFPREVCEFHSHRGNDVLVLREPLKVLEPLFRRSLQRSLMNDDSWEGERWSVYDDGRCKYCSLEKLDSVTLMVPVRHLASRGLRDPFFRDIGQLGDPSEIRVHCVLFGCFGCPAR